MNVKFLTNQASQHHLGFISPQFKSSDASYFAVAFLKVSGLNKIIAGIKDVLRRDGKVIIIAGQNFAITEPEALHTLRKLFKSYPDSKIYLAKATVRNCVFHPKLYLFQNKNECTIITGSANITEGGLVNNKESSLVFSCTDSDPVWIQAIKFFQAMIDNDSADEANLLTIKQYETYFEQQKKFNRKAKPIPGKTKSQLTFNYENLFRHFKKFDNTKREELFRNRIADYKKAEKILNEIADNTSLKQKDFEELLDKLVGSKEEYNLWHSGSLFRLRRSIYKHYQQFQQLVKYIRDNKDLAASAVFEQAKKKVQQIKGAGENYITEIMMTYNPRDYANLNKNPITVLKKQAGVNMKSSSASFNGQDYEEYCELIKEISEKLSLKNMLEADSFFNEIYWKIK